MIQSHQNKSYKLRLLTKLQALALVTGCPYTAYGLTGEKTAGPSGYQSGERQTKSLDDLPAFRFTSPQMRMFSGVERISLSPLGNNSSFSLVEGDQRDLMRGSIDISTFLKRKTANLLGAFPLGLGLTRVDQKTTSFNFQVEGVPLCQFQVKSHQFESGEFIIMGSIPRVFSGGTIPAEDWPTLEDTVDHTVLTLQSNLGGDFVGGVQGPEKCYIISEGTLVPAWKFFMGRRVLPDDESITPDFVIANNVEIFEHQPAYFDATTGKGKVYPFNPVKTPSMVETKIDNLVGDGYLTSDILISVASSPFKRAKTTDHVFNYDPGTPEFGEVSTFINATKHLIFLQDLGFQWYGLKPLKVSTNMPGLTNNARFVPQVSEGSPGQIDIGSSDGNVLKNLEYDSDVVSHEVGHFVVYRSITKTTGESLVLHEGLADYFTFARSNDACLGESICPASSQACIKPGACLRNGDNAYKVDDESWKQWSLGKGSLNHLHSQVISGMLWSLREKQIPGNILDKMVIAAISYLPNDADFSNFLLGLANADKALAAGAYFSKIEAAAKDRNLGNRMPTLSEAGSFSKNAAKDPTAGTATKEQVSGQAEPGGTQTAPAPSRTSTRGDSGGGLCGVVNGGRQGRNEEFSHSLIALLMLPMGLLMVAQRRQWTKK